MLRGARVNVPPLHGLPDVIGLLLVLALFGLTLRFLFTGGTLSDVLRPAATATLLELRLTLTPEALARAAAVLPVNEGAVRSRAVERAHEVARLLLAEQPSWTAAAVRIRGIREVDAPGVWRTAVRDRQPEPAMLTVLMLVAGAVSSRITPTAALELAGRLDVRRLAGFAASAGGTLGHEAAS
ncbi:MAG: hypothetical protein JO247_06180 [Chloroflexi bacterium]|nr:hypothetical protein [Chloroflexota bacterium]